MPGAGAAPGASCGDAPAAPTGSTGSFTAYCVESVWQRVDIEADEAQCGRGGEGGDVQCQSGTQTVRVWRRYRDFARLQHSRSLQAALRQGGMGERRVAKAKQLFPGKRYVYNNMAQAFVSLRRAKLERYLQDTFAGGPLPCSDAGHFFLDGTLSATCSHLTIE